VRQRGRAPSVQSDRLVLALATDGVLNLEHMVPRGGAVRERARRGGGGGGGGGVGVLLVGEGVSTAQWPAAIRAERGEVEEASPSVLADDHHEPVAGSQLPSHRGRGTLRRHLTGTFGQERTCNP
jgi:hypothetical protein